MVMNLIKGNGCGSLGLSSSGLDKLLRRAVSLTLTQTGILQAIHFICHCVWVHFLRLISSLGRMLVNLLDLLPHFATGSQ